jgi:hypothetical protein
MTYEEIDSITDILIAYGKWPFHIEVSREDILKICDLWEYRISKSQNEASEKFRRVFRRDYE